MLLRCLIPRKAPTNELTTITRFVSTESGNELLSAAGKTVSRSDPPDLRELDMKNASDRKKYGTVTVHSI